MNQLQLLGQKPNEHLTMSSREIAELTGKMHKNVLEDIRKMLDGLGQTSAEFSANLPDTYGRLQQVFLLPKRETMILVSGYSVELRARIVDRWLELEGAPQMSILPPEQQALVTMMLEAAAIKAVQQQQAAALTAVESRVRMVESAQILTARPANAEAITHIRSRINRIYGLSHDVIDAVMRQSLYAPKPAGMVRNEHAEAEGATYAVYWQKDVTACFERFVKECSPVTEQFVTHPFVEGRFKMRRA